MAFITRAQWGAPPLRANALLTTAPSSRTGFVGHYGGDGVIVRTEADELRLMNAYHNWHNDQSRFPNRGGFPYNVGIGPATGNVYEGRGLDRIGAHAGGANTTNIGAVMLGSGPLTEAAKRGFREAYAISNRHVGRQLLQRVHSDINATACPGEEIRAWFRSGGLAGGNAPAIPTGTTPNWPARSLYGAAWVEEAQRDLIALGYDLGAAGVDGKDGPRTQAATRDLQSKNDLVQDGIFGPRTRAVAKALLAGGRVLLHVDGALGALTITDLQIALDSYADGRLDVPSPAVRALQRKLNAAGARDWDGEPLIPDGIGLQSNVGRRVPSSGRFRTVWALQDYLGTPRDGVIDRDDSAVIRALQRRLNDGKL